MTRYDNTQTENMYIAEVYLEVAEQNEEDRELIDFLTSTWRSHGQVLGDEFPVVFNENAYRNDYRLVVMLPRRDALESRHDSQYVAYAKRRLAEAGFQAPRVVVLGEDPFSADSCSCSQPSWFILYTNYVSLESSLRCGDCFNPLPLYTIPPQESVRGMGELHDNITSWHSDYQACDRLQMNCATGEKFGLREMSQHNSSLSIRGPGHLSAHPGSNWCSNLLLLVPLSRTEPQEREKPQMPVLWWRMVAERATPREV